MIKMAFQFLALEPGGATTKGVVLADNQQDAFQKITAKGMKPLRIQGARQKVRHKRITAKDVSQLTSQLAVLMQARIPLVDGLRSIAAQDRNERLRSILDQIASQIEAGHTMSDALGPHRETFGDVYVEMIRAAEASGNMTEVLSRLASMLDRQYEMTRNVKSAMMYPICVVAAIALATVFLMMVVVPKFSEMFASRGIELPLPTKIVIGISDLLKNYWYLFLGGSVAAIMGVRRAWSSLAFRRRVDTWMHRIPFLRSLLTGVAISRFSDVFGMSLRSGLSLIDALELASRASGRPLLQVDAEKMRSQINSGRRLSDVLNTCDYFPPLSRRLIIAGEEAGEIPKMCEIVARDYDREVLHLSKNITTVVEPVLIVGLASVVLLIALAIFLPMWNMASLVG